MKKSVRYLLVALLVGALLVCVMRYVSGCETVTIDEYNSVGRPARIHPDYTGTVVPPNIAPLNFLVQERGVRYYVKIYSKESKGIEIYSRKPKIMIPMGQWHKLLDTNRGEELYFDVFVKAENGRWDRFDTIRNKIAREDIDEYLLYRKFYPVHNFWNDMGVYQRDLRNYDESIVLHNASFGKGCVNCHTFCRNHPNKMLISIRSIEYGSSALLVEDGAVEKVKSKFTYSSWHPSGRLLVCSMNSTRPFYHSFRDEVRGVLDFEDMLAYYLVESKTLKTSPKISQKDHMETYPSWSPDGRYLYFCRAPILMSRDDIKQRIVPPSYDKIKFDLVRISYDLSRDEWGESETILSARQTGQSILEPQISPDGRWLLFCMCDYGGFPVFQPSSDLYLMDLKTAQETGEYKYRRLKINSSQSESWHSWSGNSRWIAFSSKMTQGLFTRLHLSYVDANGKVYKSLLLPQRDPTFYDSCLQTYNTPELVAGPVQFKGEQLLRAVRSSGGIEAEVPTITMATPKAERIAGEPPGERE